MPFITWVAAELVASEVAYRQRAWCTFGYATPLSADDVERDIGDDDGFFEVEWNVLCETLSEAMSAIGPAGYWRGDGYSTGVATSRRVQVR